MDFHDVNEALHRNCEIYDPYFRGLDPSTGPIWPYCEKCINLKKIFLFNFAVVRHKLTA